MRLCWHLVACGRCLVDTGHQKTDEHKIWRRWSHRCVLRRHPPQGARAVWEANFGTLASVANRWPIGLAHQHSGFSFAFPGQNAPPIAVWGGRTAENSRVLHRHSNWHSCPHRHNSAPLSSCAPVHALIGNVCTGASAHRRTGSDLCSGSWLGQACSGSQASRLSHALLKKTITYLLASEPPYGGCSTQS